MIINTITNVIEESWAMISIFSVVLISIRVLYIVDKGKKFVFYEELLNFIFIIYALMLYQILTSTEDVSSGLNLVPFKEIMRYKFGTTLFYYNVIGNILIFLPFGYYVSRYVNAKKISHILITTAIVSFTVESVQYRIGRAFDIDDILLNVVGGMLGFLLYSLLTSIKSHLPKFLQKDAFYNIISLFLIGLVVLYLSKFFGWW